MARRPLLICWLVMAALCVLVVSHPLEQLSARHKRYVLMLPLPPPPSPPSSSHPKMADDSLSMDLSPALRAILWILRQKCLEWRRRQVVNLPQYCYTLLSSRSVSPFQLNRYYGKYERMVPLPERQADARRAEAHMALGPPLRVEIKETPAMK